MRARTVIAKNADPVSAVEVLFNFKNFYFTIYRKKVLVSDHTAKIECAIGGQGKYRRR